METPRTTPAGTRPATLADIAAASRRRHVDGLARAHQPGPRQRRRPASGSSAPPRELNYVPNAQARALTSGRTRADRRPRLRRHQPVLLRHHPRHAAAAEGRRLHAAARRHRGVRRARGRHAAQAAPVVRRRDPRRLPPLRPPPRRRSPPRCPLVAINRQTRGRAERLHRHPGRHRAGARAPRLARAPRHRLRLRTRRPSWPNEGRWRALQRAARSATASQPRRIGPFAPTQARRAPRPRTPLLNAGVDRVHRLQRPARHRHADAPARARRVACPTTSASSAATTSSAPTSATRR